MIYRPIVEMFPDTYGQWHIIPPGDYELNFANSETGGLQEALDVAILNGFPLEVTGRGATFSTANHIQSHLGVFAKPAQNAKVTISNCSINFDNTVLGDGLVIDSSLMLDWSMPGSPFVYEGDGAAFKIAPRNILYPDGVVGFSANKVSLHCVSTVGGSGPCGVVFDASQAPITNNEFSVNEPMGNGIGVNGIKVVGPYAFEQNKITSVYNHSWTGAQVQIGMSPTGQAMIRHNTWNLTGMRPKPSATTNTGRGIYSYGSYDTFTIGGITSEDADPAKPYLDGIYFNTGADHNTVIGGQAYGYSHADLVDNGSGNVCINYNGRLPAAAWG